MSNLMKDILGDAIKKAMITGGLVTTDEAERKMATGWSEESTVYTPLAASVKPRWELPPGKAEPGQETLHTGEEIANSHHP